MVRAKGDKRTGDLLAWTPPEPRVGFAADEVRGASLGSRYCRAMALALKDCGKSREQVAEAMSIYLGAPVSVAMLNAYVSEAREGHTINVLRYAALVHATGDKRLLAIQPELFGHIVVDQRYKHWIASAIARDKGEELLRQAEWELRQAKSGGG